MTPASNGPYCHDCRHYRFDWSYKMPQRCWRYRTPVGNPGAAQRLREADGFCGPAGQGFEAKPAPQPPRPWWRFW